ncbi:hypothetical protein ANCDUO_23146, partial [Ancylostoma duodenale]
MQARKTRYDVIGLTETGKHRKLNATFDTGEELFLGTCDSRGVGGVGVLVNTNLVMNVNSFKQLTTRIGRLRLKRCGPIPALTIFVAHAPTSCYDEGTLRPSIWTWRSSTEKTTQSTSFWEDAVVDNIDEEYDRLVHYLRDSAKKAEGSRATKRPMSYETLDLIRQRGATRATDDYQLMSELAK